MNFFSSEVFSSNYFGNIKVLSVDVFDTLLRRRIDPPEAVISLVAERINESEVISLSSRDYLDLRGRLEKDLRSEASTQGYDPECSIDEITERITSYLGLPVQTKALLVEAELYVEEALLDGMPGIKTILEDISKKLRIVAISDTYLTESHIWRLLKKAGLDHIISHVYSSCDHRLTKKSGRLFEKVLSMEGVEPFEMMHIGDNFHGDVLSPRNHGIHALHYYDTCNLHRKNILRSAHLSSNPACRFPLYFPKVQPNISDSHTDYLLYRFGCEVVGPIFVLFSCMLIEKLAEANVGSVYFIARDSFLLKKLFMKLCPEKRPPIKSTYLGISRYTAALASIRKLDAREVKLMGFACSTLSDAIHRFGVVDDLRVQEIVKRCGFNIEAKLHQGQLYCALEKLFDDNEFQSIVLGKAESMRATLRSYLEEKSFFDLSNPPAIVDIGWHGTIQECLIETFGDEELSPDMKGFYLSLMEPVIKRTMDKTGIVHDYRHATPAETALPLYQEIFEMSSRGFHGSTVGYKTVGEHVVPSWKAGTRDRENEKKNNQHVLEIHRGILDCASYFKQFSSLVKPDLTALKNIAVAQFDTAMSYPDKRLVKEFAQCFHSDDFGLEQSTGLVQKFNWRDIRDRKRFVQEFLSNPWREASLVQSSLPCLSIYNAVKKIICWKRAAKSYSS